MKEPQRRRSAWFPLAIATLLVVAGAVVAFEAHAVDVEEDGLNGCCASSFWGSIPLWGGAVLLWLIATPFLAAGVIRIVRRRGDKA